MNINMNIDMVIDYYKIKNEYLYIFESYRDLLSKYISMYFFYGLYKKHEKDNKISKMIENFNDKYLYV